MDWILIEEGRELDRAIDLAQKGVNLCKQNPKISDQIRGTIIDTLGWGYIRKAEVETNPQEKQALLEKAQKKLEEAGFLVRTNPSIGYHLCVIYERTEQYAKALSLGKKLIAHAQRVGKFKEIELVNQLVERVTPKVNQ